jgi:hypothetical protein
MGYSYDIITQKGRAESSSLLGRKRAKGGPTEKKHQG